MKQNILIKNIETTRLKKLERFVDFCIDCYILYWINFIAVSAAPGKDLGLVKIVKNYKTTGKMWATSVLNAMNRHLCCFVNEKLWFLWICLITIHTTLAVKAEGFNSLNKTGSHRLHESSNSYNSSSKKNIYKAISQIIIYIKKQKRVVDLIIKAMVLKLKWEKNH